MKVLAFHLLVAVLFLLGNTTVSAQDSKELSVYADSICTSFKLNEELSASELLPLAIEHADDKKAFEAALVGKEIKDAMEVMGFYMGVTMTLYGSGSEAFMNKVFKSAKAKYPDVKEDKVMNSYFKNDLTIEMEKIKGCKDSARLIRGVMNASN